MTKVKISIVKKSLLIKIGTPRYLCALFIVANDSRSFELYTPAPRPIVDRTFVHPFPNKIKAKIMYLIICCYLNIILRKYDNIEK